LLMDPSSGVVPMSMNNSLVSTTVSCVAIGCLSELDGPTDLHLAAMEITPGHKLVFDGYVETPNRYLAFCTILLEEIIATKTWGLQTRVQVWANDPREPDDIRVFLLKG
jgi:hypothetical protein